MSIRRTACAIMLALMTLLSGTRSIMEETVSPIEEICSEYVTDIRDQADPGEETVLVLHHKAYVGADKNTLEDVHNDAERNKTVRVDTAPEKPVSEVRKGLADRPYSTGEMTVSGTVSGKAEQPEGGNKTSGKAANGSGNGKGNTKGTGSGEGTGSANSTSGVSRGKHSSGEAPTADSSQNSGSGNAYSGGSLPGGGSSQGGGTASQGGGSFSASQGGGQSGSASGPDVPSGGSGSGNSGGSSTGSGSSAEGGNGSGTATSSDEGTVSGSPVHVHRWVTEVIFHEAVTHIEHHDEVTEQRWVSDPVRITKYMCGVCGAEFDTQAEAYAHEDATYERAMETGDMSLIHSGHHTETQTIDRGWYETVTVREAYDETVTDVPAWEEHITRCADCGAEG